MKTSVNGLVREELVHLLVVAGKPVNNMIKLSSLIKEVEVGQGHENDRDMVVGVAEILRMIRDMKNREEVLHSMIEKFNRENVIYNRGEFTKMCGL